MKRFLRASILTAVLSFCCVSLPAQSIGDLLKKASSGLNLGNTAKDYVSALLGKDKVTAEDLVGTWTYSEPVLVLESDQVLGKIGGAVMAQTAEKKLSSVMEKIGVKPGVVKMTFNSDGTYTCELSGHTIRGTYEVQDATLTLKKLNFTALSANVKKTGNSLQLAVQADKLLTLVSSLTSIVPEDGLLSTVTSLFKSYDGMQVGVKFEK